MTRLADRRAYQAAYYDAHRDEVRAKRAAWYVAHRDELMPKHAAYNASHREQHAAYYVTHHEEMRVKDLVRNPLRRPAKRPYMAVYDVTHRDEKQERERIRKARQAGNGAFTVLPRDWRRMLHRYRNACAYCGRSGVLTREHVIPIARGGRHSIGNLLPACRGCNFGKNRKLLIEWRAAQVAA